MTTPAEMIDKLKGDLCDLNENMKTLQAKADGEGRALTEDETREYDRLSAEFNRTSEEIGRREVLLAQSEKLKTVIPPRSQPQNPEPQAAADPAMRQSSRTPRIEVVADRGKWGWNHFGDFAKAVVSGSARNGHVDPRLVANAPTTYSQEGVGADGGFAVPPDFRQEIMRKVAGVDSLLSRTDIQTTTANSMTYLVDETTPWSTSGIRVYRVAEAAQITESKPQLTEKQLRLVKMAALVPVTEEMLADSATISGHINSKVPDAFDYAHQNELINGSGVGQLQGILAAGCTVSQAKDTTTSPTQAAATFTYRNAVEMYNRLHPKCIANAAWLVNPDVFTQLQFMRFDNNRSSNPIPVYVPPGGASASPYGTLLGRPVIPVEACAALGTVGDVILADLSKYITLFKAGSSVKQDVSMHIYFEYDMSCFRFVFRSAGMNWWATAVTMPNSAVTRSCFVTLATRA